MDSHGYTTEPFYDPYYESKPETQTAFIPSPLLSEKRPPIKNNSITSKLLMVWPLAAHLVGSVAIAAIVSSFLNGRQYYLERQPQIKLADGTYDSEQLGRYNLLQSDVVTILSGSLMILRWIAAAWAVPLCWRAVFFLTERNGLFRRDIEWMIKYGVLPPSALFRCRYNIFIGTILIFTLTPFPVSLLLTGSISWLPSNITVDLQYHPTINISGVSLDPNSNISSVVYNHDRATLNIAVTKNFNTAWVQAVEEGKFRRVVPSVSRLNIDSTVANVVMPSFAITKIVWSPALEDNTRQLLQTMLLDQDSFSGLSEQMTLPGAAALLVNYTRKPLEPGSIKFLPPKAWPMLINIGTKSSYFYETEDCNSSNTLLPENTTIPSFRLNSYGTPTNTSIIPSLYGCFAYAKVSFDATYGLCRNCRVVAYSTVQNETSLETLQHDYGVTRSVDHALRNMPQYSPAATPLKEYLPDPAKDLEVYATTFLTRLYLALWNSWEDIPGSGPGSSTEYKPAIQVLRADIAHGRVYAWLGLQLSLTFAGLVFVWLQSGSQYPLITETTMVAFDIDTTEVSKGSSSSNQALEELLRIERKGEGWRIIAAN